MLARRLRRWANIKTTFFSISNVHWLPCMLMTPLRDLRTILFDLVSLNVSFHVDSM